MEEAAYKSNINIIPIVKDKLYRFYSVELKKKDPI
jgi:hypothetical protein